MKILSMTATFGKLNQEKITFAPDLNVIQAPNEWGKSTWCAFIEAMLYGIDTRERSTQTSLAAKEKYAPWSGQPMSGRMDLLWQGRNVTIERRTRGRTPFGEFSAYETDTGLPVPELTATTCGQVLTGVERSVFTRTVFLKLTNLPMDEDESLRKRLNGLVTTGDESGTAETLATKLKLLKNRCRHNKTGLLPEAITLRDNLQMRLTQWQTLQTQTERIRQQQEEDGQWIEKLNNHLAHLEYQAMAQQQQKIADAQTAYHQALARYQEKKQQCAALPEEGRAEEALQQLYQLRIRLDQVTQKEEALPPMTQMPIFPAPFTALDGQTMVQMAQADQAAYHQALAQSKTGITAYLPAILGVCSVAFALIPHWGGIALAALGVLGGSILFISQRAKRMRQREKAEALVGKYAPNAPQTWVSVAENYARQLAQYDQENAARLEKRDQQTGEKQALMAQIDRFCGGSTLSVCEEQWRNVAKQHQALNQAKQDMQRAKELLDALTDIQTVREKPEMPDTLQYSREQTEQQLLEATLEQKRLQTGLDQCVGQMEAMGSQEDLTRRLQEANRRVAALEETEGALILALDTLQEASMALQRRFAPKISRRAEALFGELTNSRYDRLQLEQDLSVRVGAQGEVTMEKSAWRSDGTVDQLYLALRLAVAEELAPEAPLILDDALVRFDDTRLQAAMSLLKKTAEARQVILFTCQNREKEVL